ncbi:MAG: hypothetical protein ACXWUG_21605 [Polyangiales bacterium]
MQLGKLAIAAVVLVAGASACSHEEERADAKTAQNFTAMEKTATSRVDAGGSFEVAVTSPLSTETSEPGDIFSARLRAPLLGNDGKTLAYEGAAVWGHVVAIQHGENPRLALAFDSIDTVNGTQRIDARVGAVHDGHFSIGTDRAPGEAASDVVLRSTAPRAIGGGPKPEGENKGECAAPAAPKPTVSLRTGTAMDLTLTNPLIVTLSR